jgi:hypothetical protein
VIDIDLNLSETTEKPNNKSRKRSYYRYQRRRAITRKLRLIRSAMISWRVVTKQDIGRLAKGKIHCSCCMCRDSRMNVIKYKAMDEDAKRQMGEEGDE